MPLDAMIDKAMRLLKAGRVERLSYNQFNVIGDHGTYNVVRNREGKINCSCPGFQSRGRCSHSTAVLIMSGQSRRR
ncbi:MAG: SWIM zinc finger family protein [Candidatus Bathyarchaeota archaeon]|nr:MAG: SWIM zinc finger family protein [Candidatus Bathyarchaeota archaeon]